MPTLASSSAISRARASRPPRVAARPRRSAVVVGVEAEADDVHGGVGEGHRDLGAVEVGQAGRARRVARALLAAELVVVGQRPELDAVGLRARGERLGLERAVGDGGVAVQIGVHRSAAAEGAFLDRGVDARAR